MKIKMSFHQLRHPNPFFRQFGFLLWLGILFGGQLIYAQQSPKMNITRIATNGELTVRGYTANFPAPILTTITVIDGQGNYVTKLADTLRWLDRNEIANNGVPISQIWSPFFEYHEEDNRIPPVPDVYKQSFGPYVTEIRWCDNFPTSTMLVMDVSSSMEEEISFARAGANAFVDLMRPVDRAGIVQFSGRVLLYQPLTTDTQLLHTLITNAMLDRGTAINDAILRGIAGVKDVPCRRMVIVYTDGVDVNSTATAAMVIDTALTYRVPVFTIALGNDTEEDSLRAISDRTGGLFFKAATASEMETIYRRLSAITQNYYVTAHGSTDPNYNNTWRIVDLTANVDGRKVRATGRYFVSGTPPPVKMTDIGIRLSAKTDTFVVRGTDFLPATEPGKKFTYHLIVQNFGLYAGDSIRIVQHLPDSIQYLQASLPPAIETADSLVWKLDRLEAGRVFEINTEVILNQNIPKTIDFLISPASMTARNDSTRQNNQAVDTLYVLFPKIPPEEISDLMLEQLIETDTTIIVAGDTIPAVIWGDSLSFNYKIKNNGPSTADSIVFWNIIPDSTQFVDFNIPPSYQRGDTLFWLFDSLAVNDSILIFFRGQVADLFPTTPYPLINIIGVIAENDTTPENNIDSTRFYALKPPKPSSRLTDLVLKFFSKTDTSIVIGQKEFTAVKAGEAVEYWIAVHNAGPGRADSIQVIQNLPDSVIFAAASIIPVFRSADALKWYFDYLNVNDSIHIRINFNVANKLPRSLTELVSSALISAPDDSVLSNNFAEDTVKVVFKTIPAGPKCDLAIFHSVMTDTSIFYENTNVPAVRWGDNYQYSIKIVNNGPGTAKNIRLTDIKPDSVILDRFNQTPARASGDSLFWGFDSLASGDSTLINFQATVKAFLPFSPFPLPNYVAVESPEDSTVANNQDSSLVMAIRKKITQFYNLAITQSVQADTAILVNNLQMPAVFVGKTIPYQLKVINHGPGLAKNFTIWDKLPGFLILSQFNISPTIVKVDSLFWSIDSLASRDSLVISYNALVSENIPYSPFLLENKAGIRAEKDMLASDNDSYSQIYALKRPVPPIFTTDISVYLVAQTDSFRIINQDTMRIVHDDEFYQYLIRVRNERDIPAEDVKIVDYLPDFIAPVDYDPRPIAMTNDSLIWQLNTLPPRGAAYFTVKVRVLSPPSAVETPLINKVVVSAKNEDPTLLFNNSAFDTVYYIPTLPGDWTAQIQATPTIVDAGKPVKVKVKVATDINKWDVWVYLANGKIDSGYADTFIKTNSLKADEWLEIVPDYSQTQIVTDSDEEQISFELHARDRFNTLKQARTTVLIQKADEIDIDQNVFEPDKDNSITIKFKLPQDEMAVLDLYDITGTKITNVAESQFQAGWNAVTWNGLTEYGQKVGSGFYILTLRANGYSAWKKLMIVR